MHVFKIKDLSLHPNLIVERFGQLATTEKNAK